MQFWVFEIDKFGKCAIFFKLNNFRNLMSFEIVKFRKFKIKIWVFSQINNFWNFENCKIWKIFGMLQIIFFWNSQIENFCGFPNWKFLVFSKLQIFRI